MLLKVELFVEVEATVDSDNMELAKALIEDIKDAATDRTKWSNDESDRFIGRTTLLGYDYKEIKDPHEDD